MSRYIILSTRRHSSHIIFALTWRDKQLEDVAIADQPTVTGTDPRFPVGGEGGGANLRAPGATPTFGPKFSENCMKTKKILAVAGGGGGGGGRLPQIRQ